MSYVDKQLLKDIIEEIALIDGDDINYSDDDGNEMEFDDWGMLAVHIYIEEKYGK